MNAGGTHLIFGLREGVFIGEGCFSLRRNRNTQMKEGVFKELKELKEINKKYSHFEMTIYNQIETLNKGIKKRISLIEKPMFY